MRTDQPVPVHLATVSLVCAAAAGCLLPSATPGWVINREPLEPCGVEEVGLTGDFNEAARTCLLNAFEAGDGAELISTMTTVEGDPITRITRVRDDGSVEVFVDSTRDRYGSGTWDRVLCAALVPVDEANDPPNVVFPEQYVFVEEGCEQLPASWMVPARSGSA